MSETTSTVLPEGFVKVLQDFLGDVLNTFPEYKESLDDRLQAVLDGKTEGEQIESLFIHCKEVYPERFFDLLYHNEDIFTDKAINTNFLPGIDFSDAWSQDLSDNTRTVIWKYLQLIMFSVVTQENDSSNFGDTAKLFEAIDEEELKKKLEETMSQMAGIFDGSGVEGMFSGNEGEELPNPEDIHSHLSEMMEGKLGKLAAEITEQTLKEMDPDLADMTDVGDVFQKLFKNPGKLMAMVKKVGEALDAKLKSGEIKESELMEEAADFMAKMKDMPGMKNMQQMFGKMGMPTGGANVNMGAMQGKMRQNIRAAKQKERMRAKLARRREAKDEQTRVLEAQLAAARAANASARENAMEGTAETSSKKRRRRKRRKGRNKNK